jgi:phosphoglycerate kinase
MDPSAQTKVVPADKIPAGWMGLDIGPETLKLFKSVVDKSKMIVWNGPMGMFEIKKFSHGTKELAKIVAEAKGESIVGGGSTIEAIRELHLDHKFDFISTGGGAMLEFLEGKMLPGIKPLIKN